MYQDLIIILGDYISHIQTMTYEGKLSMARVIATFSIIVGCGLVLLSKLISPFVLPILVANMYRDFFDRNVFCAK